MPKQPSTKVLKTCRIEKAYIEYCTMQNINFNGLVNELLEVFIMTHQRNAKFRETWEMRGIEMQARKPKEP